MKFGVGLPTYADSKSRLSPYRLQQYVKKAEKLGYSCGWMGEHIVQPPHYGYLRSEPLTTLSALAGMTDDLEFGTAVLLLPLRHPVHVAKSVANIQYLADRRFNVGVGLGHIQSDFDAVNVDKSERSERYWEGLRLLYRLLNEDKVTFEGEYYDVEDITIEPNLGQPPRILVGGGGVNRNGERFVPKRVKERLLHADGWVVSSGFNREMAIQDWEEMATYLEAQGRDRNNFDKIAQYRTYLVPGVDSDIAIQKQAKRFRDVIGENREMSYAQERYGFGTIEDIREDIAKYEDAGFDQVIMKPATFNFNELITQLEAIKEYIYDEFQ